VPNTAILESNWRKLDIWSRSTKGYREAGSDDSRKSKDCSVLTEEDISHLKLVILYTLRSHL
jgi:hypothetical protein